VGVLGRVCGSESAGPAEYLASLSQQRRQQDLLPSRYNAKVWVRHPGKTGVFIKLVTWGDGFSIFQIEKWRWWGVVDGTNCRVALSCGCCANFHRQRAAVATVRKGKVQSAKCRQSARCLWPVRPICAAQGEMRARSGKAASGRYIKRGRLIFRADARIRGSVLHVICHGVGSAGGHCISHFWLWHGIYRLVVHLGRYIPV
jgi:hypothetical protein